MNSYRCAQCGLTNWTTTEFCKRCKSPNPNFVYTHQTAQYADHAQHNGYGNQPNYAPQNYNPFEQQPDFSAPPPPNAFGNETGTANYGHYPQNGYQNQPFHSYNQNYLSDSEQQELKTAQKQIRNAWVSGAIVSGITILFAFILSAMSSKEIELIASPLEMIITAIIFGGLTIGVYFKSRACAVILCGLFLLDKIVTFAATGKFSGAILTFVFIYYFVYGIKGTFTYRRIMKGRM